MAKQNKKRQKVIIIKKKKKIWQQALEMTNTDVLAIHQRTKQFPICAAYRLFSLEKTVYFTINVLLIIILHAPLAKSNLKMKYCNVLAKNTLSPVTLPFGGRNLQQNWHKFKKVKKTIQTAAENKSQATNITE